MTVQELRNLFQRMGSECIKSERGGRLFNYWDGSIHCMRMLGESGIWELFIPGIGQGSLYKFELETPHHQVVLEG